MLRTLKYTRSARPGGGFLMLLTGALLLLAVPAWTSNEARPALIEGLRVEGPLDFCAGVVPLADREVRERLEKELLLMLWDRDQVVLWLKRSTRHLPYIEAQLAKAGLPDDLKYIAIVESALRPHVGSPAGAIGFWQFLPATARRYGLRVDPDVDERRSLVASTRAALAYFSELHEQFGDWSLAAAAFNMGEEGLRAEILAQQVEDYYRLYLPQETQRYLFRILAAKLILTQPEEYGFRLRADDYYPPVVSRRIALQVPAETSLRVVADAAGTDFKRIKDLNPELRGHYLQAGAYQLALPPETFPGLQQRFERARQQWLAERRQRLYIVQPGDNLSTIAAHFEVPLAALLIWNRLDLNQPIHPGDRLVIETLPGENEDDVKAQ